MDGTTQSKNYPESLRKHGTEDVQRSGSDEAWYDYSKLLGRPSKLPDAKENGNMDVAGRWVLCCAIKRVPQTILHMYRSI
jgi:hypothetical protein